MFLRNYANMAQSVLICAASLVLQILLLLPGLCLVWTFYLFIFFLFPKVIEAAHSCTVCGGSRRRAVRADGGRSKRERL